MFSQTAEYALRALVCLAQEAGEQMTTAQIAAKTRVPPHYLSKVLQALNREDLVKATRGLGGGYQLSRGAEAISVLEAVNAVDPMKRIHRCPLGLKEHGANLCTLHRKLDDAMGLIEEALGSTSIAEVAVAPEGSIPLCPGPVAIRA